MSNPVTFTTSGTVQAQDGTYLTRAADEELFQLCRQGEYAYILTSRQMGKSSLMVATAERLQGEGIQTAIVDLQRLGAQTTDANSWYLGVLTVLARKLRILPQLMTWWEENAGLGAAQRFLQFIEDLVLPRVTERLVVFIDEIDSTLSLDFTDDFFIALRYCFTARAENPDFRKLSFVLIGVATPSELIRDQKRTPFNIGTLVELRDFDETEAMPLAAGLGLSEAAAQQVLRWVLAWTGGHPYLTQRVCGAILQQNRQDWDADAVAALIGQLFFGEQREQDNNLQFVQSMLTGRAPEQNVLGVLSTYREIRRDRQAIYDEDHSILKAHLKLSGVVKRVGSVLHVRNGIYWEVFGLGWVKEQWPENWWQRLKPAMPLLGGLTAGLVVLGGVSAYALQQRNEAQAQAKRAEDALAETEVERQNALDAQAEAEEQAAVAEAARKDADDRRLEAEVAQQDAEDAKQDADEQRLAAEAAQESEAGQRKQALAAQQRAESGEAEARLQAEIALVRRLSAQAGQIQNQPSYLTARNVLLAVEAMRRSLELQIASLEADQALRQGLFLLGEKVPVFEAVSNEIYSDTRRQTQTTYENHLLEAIQDSSNSIRVVRAPNNEQVSSIDFPEDVRLLALSNNGEYVAVSPESSRQLEVFHVDSEQRILTTPLDLYTESVEFSPQDKYIALLSSYQGSTQQNVTDIPLRILNLQSGIEVTRILFPPPAFLDFRFSKNEEYIIVYDPANLAYGSTNSTGSWKIGTSKHYHLLESEYLLEKTAVDPETRLVSTFSRNSSNEEKYLKISSLESQDTIFEDTTDFEVFDLAFSNSSQSFLAAGIRIENDLRKISIFEIRESVNSYEIQSSLRRIRKITLSKDGRYVAIVGFESTHRSSSPIVEIWDIESRNKTRAIRGGLLNNFWTYDASFSSNSNFLILSNESSDNETIVYDLENGAFLPVTLKMTVGGSGTAFSAVSNSGKYAVVGNYRHHYLGIFDLITGRQIGLVNHDDIIVDAAFDKDGMHFATISIDGSARVWNASTGKGVAGINFDGGISEVQFSPDGRFLVSSSSNGIYFDLWHPKDMISEACSRLYRNLYRQEWSIFIGSEVYRRTCPNVL